MGIFLQFFISFSGRYARMKSFLLCLLLLPVAVGVLAVPKEQHGQTTQLSVGILLEGNGTHEQAVFDTLATNTSIEFSIVSDIETLRQSVAVGDFAAGYVLRDDFSSRLDALRFKDLVRVIKFEEDFYHSYINEVVFSAVFGQAIPAITQDFLAQRGIPVDEDILRASIADYHASDALFTIDITHPGGITPIPSSEGGGVMTLVRGIVCIMLLLFTMLAMVFAAGNRPSFALFHPHLGATRTELYSVVPVYFFGFLSALVALIVCAVLLPSGMISLPSEILRLMLYQLSLVVVGVLLGKLLRRDTIVLLIPFILLAVLVSHPIFFDISTFLPQTKPVLQCLPSYLYLTLGL